MKDTKNTLLDGVKTTVARYGLGEMSTRKLSEVCGINNGLIYHYFSGLEELLYQAYSRENDAIFRALLYYLHDVHDIPFDFATKARLWFHKAWREFLSDPERLVFCTEYYHSSHFRMAGAFHERQLAELVSRVGAYFGTESECVQTMYSLLSLFYDSAKRVVDGALSDTPETEESIFSICFGVLNSQIKKEK